MAEITVYSKNGKAGKKIELDPAIFEIKISERLLEIVQRLYANNKRTGNAHTKTRGEVRGGGARPWRQKGTGRARVSSIRSPLWRGGGKMHGPRTRDIMFTIPKKVRRKALITALTKKFKEEKIVVIDDVSLDNPKTKELYTILSNVKVHERNTLLVVKEYTENIQKAARNIEKLSLKRVGDVNAYNVLKKQMLVCDVATIMALQERLMGTQKEVTAVSE